MTLIVMAVRNVSLTTKTALLKGQLSAISDIKELMLAAQRYCEWFNVSAYLSKTKIYK